MSIRLKAPATVQVRPLTVDDIPRVQEIDHKTTGRLRARTFEDPLRNCIGGDLAISYVAEMEGEVVGFIFGWLVDRLWASHEGARLEILGVDPSCRRRGVGRHLLGAFVNGCREKGIGEIHVLAHSADRDLKAFLGKQSFQQGRLVDYECFIGATTA